ncbi:MAG: M15 family metallopeptidase [Sediminibacterium sp.]|nr:M15 family metallopeptidase [Sediminibacterium sp.]MDP3128816.1 M15 family metallopeptidase [Sediminibacterium sp.]
MTPDKITLERIETLHPKLRDEAGKIYAEICQALTGKVGCRFAYCYRSFAEQAILYAQGRTCPGNVVTNARSGRSYHNYGFAIDIVLLIDNDGNGSFETASWNDEADFDGDKKADWLEIVTIFKQYGWAWGGDWKFTDMPHFQKTFDRSIVELLTLYDEKKVIPNTNYVNI